MDRQWIAATDSEIAASSLTLLNRSYSKPEWEDNTFSHSRIEGCYSADE